MKGEWKRISWDDALMELPIITEVEEGVWAGDAQYLLGFHRSGRISR